MIAGERLSGTILLTSSLTRMFYTRMVRSINNPLNFANLNLAFTFAVQDLKSLWQWYRYGYEKELLT